MTREEYIEELRARISHLPKEERESALSYYIEYLEDATDKTVVWSSSDEKIAKVENGKVTAVAEGEAVITVKAGDKTATCKVTVVKDTGTGVASAAPAVAVLAVLSAVAVAGVCLKKRRG